MARCTLITDGDSYCKASSVDSGWHPVGGLLALVFTGARPFKGRLSRADCQGQIAKLAILLADTDFL